MTQTPRTDYGILDWMDEEGPKKEPDRQTLRTREEFFDRYALGPKVKPSCFVCGRDDYEWPPAIQHMELPGIVCCHKCRDAALAQPQEEPRLASYMMKGKI